MADKQTGVVAWFSKAKGYGFITPDSGDKDYFVQYSHILVEGFKALLPDQRVEFEVGQNNKGDIATNVRILD